MMLTRNLRKIIIGTIISLVVSCIISPAAFAAEPHEDPETAKPVFSGIALFQYYSNSLDSVLKNDPVEVKARLGKLPFAYIPQNLEKTTNDFAVSSMNVSYLVVNIDEELRELSDLISQYRFNESILLAAKILGEISQTGQELEQIERTIKTIGGQLNVLSAPYWSSLRNSYNEVLAKIKMIKEMPYLRQDILISSIIEAIPLEVLSEILQEQGITVKELKALLEKQIIIFTETINKILEGEKITPAQAVNKMLERDINIEVVRALGGEQLNPTELTLKIEPEIAFVGDSIRFVGRLTSEGKPLARREIDILLNGLRYLTTITESNGNYHGTLQVPYRYDDMDLQVLYYPKNEDIGRYVDSLNPAVRLRTLYYKSKLEIRVENKACPGAETTITGRFDYGLSSPPEERKIEIYVDNVLTAEASTGEEFSLRIKLSPELDVGRHTITVSAVDAERYAPVGATAILNVTRSTPVLEMTTPMVAMIPGSIILEGKLYSEIGPLSGALIMIKLGKSQVELVSAEDGTFETKIKTGMGFGLIGSQDLGIQVIPREPWHAMLTTTRNIVTANVVNCSSILILLAVLGIFLPGRLKLKFRAYLRRKTRPAVAIAEPEPSPAPVYSESVLPPALTEESGETDGEPRNRVFHWYRLAIRLAQIITKALLKPHQTLREFAREISRLLGPAGEYFIELTKMVERLLYSKQRATDEDVQRSQQLSHNIEEGLKGAGV